MTAVHAQIFDIASRHRGHPNQVGAVADFELAPAGDLDARTLLEDPSISLYCLDSKGRRALFVETPRGADPHGEAFLYQAQFRHATRAFALAYEDFVRAADERGGPHENVVFLYSVGRCGSTLLSRAFHQLDDVLSLSEPNALSQRLGAPDDPATADLLRSAVRWLCKPAGRKRPTHYVVKLRAEGTALATALHRLFPESRALFMYRDAADVVRSYVRAFHPLPAAVRGYHEDPVGFLARHWLASVQGYLAARERGVPIRAFRYEDLARDPHAVFGEIARACGTPPAGGDGAAFEDDSQAGSNLSHRSLEGRPTLDLGTREQLAARVRAVLAEHPTVREPDAILPGTWTPALPPTRSAARE